MAVAPLARQAKKAWREWFNSLPPAQRRAILRTTPRELDAAGRLAAERAEKRSLKRLTESVPGAAWLDAADRRGEQFPPGGTKTAMRWAARSVRYGEGLARPRLTPPQCVESEDALDGLTPTEAAFYDHPPSPSAVAIHRHAAYTRDGLRRIRK